MLTKIVLGFGLIIVAFVIFVATRPADYQVERQITLSSSASVIFSKINNFHEWQDWSPWEKLDPTMKKTYAGSSAGVGAIYSWEGNKSVGKGKMTIIESTPYEKILIRLEFFEPWVATNTTTFSIVPTAAGTFTLKWRMVGQNNFIGKIFSLFMNMDKMVGSDFEKGLRNLKELTEKPSSVH